MTIAERMATETHKPWSGASVETISAFLTTLATVQTEFPKFHLSAFNFWGKSESQMRAEATAQRASNKRRAGSKALVRQYGHELASKIVGKNLRG